MLSEVCRQTYALVKKGVLVRSRAPLRFAVEALAPIAAAMFLVLLYSMSIADNSVNVPVGTGNAFRLKDAAFFATHQGVKDESNAFTRAYAGTSSPLELYYSVCCTCIDTVKTKQVISNAIGINPTLIDAAEASTCKPSKCLAVVVFSECSLNWNYTIRMPSAFVANTSLIVASGPTSEADPIKSGGTNAYKSTRIASYLVNGFVSLQAAINRQILSLAAPDVAWGSQPLVTAFTPFNQSQVDTDAAVALAQRKAASMRGIVRQASGAIVGLVLSPMVFLLGAEISVERELRVRDTLKIMGMYDAAYYLSLVLTSMILLFPSLIIASGVLVASVFPNVDVGALLWIFVQFACACVPLPFISSLFVRSPSWSGFAAVGLLVLLIGSAIIATSVTTIGMPDRVGASLISLVGVQQTFDVLCTFQANAFESQDTVPTIDLTYSLPQGGSRAATYSNMCLLDAILYWILFLYLEAVFPGEQGVPRRWYFVFTEPYRYFFRSKGQQPLASPREPLGFEMDAQDLANFEPAAEASVCAVETRNLTKIFPALRRIDQPKVAVNNLSMKMYEGQILALLGHNSAGKSTTLSMLTGCLEPTSGSVLLRGPSGLQDTRSGRVPIGFCPQYDVLWPSLTVYETMCVYAQIKGLSSRDMDAAISKMIESLEMTSKLHYPTGSLSGGQKRRLCVANALIGDCKIVFLDEPTSGMDPFSRRALWKLIKEYQPGRCIVFTTHYMDEADILGDSVAVLSHGSLRVSGSPLFLKRRFGCGYTLSVLLPQIGTCDAQKCVDEVMAKVLEHVPSAAIVMQEGQEVIINLSAASFTSFPNMLLSLDESRASSRIRDYGISLTSLEEVFMRIEDDGAARPPPAAAVSEHNFVESVPVDLEAQAREAAWEGISDCELIGSETPVSELGEAAPSRRRKTIDRAEKKFGSDSMDIQKLKEAYEPIAPSSGGSSFFSQFYGLFVKRVIWFKRDHSVAVIGFLLPIVISIGAAAIMQQIPVLTCDNPAMLYSVPLTLDLFTLYGAKIPSSPYFLAPVNSNFLVATSFPVSPTSASVVMAYSPISSFPTTDPNLLASISANRGSIPGALNSCCSDLMASSSSLNAFYNAALLHSLPSTLTTAYSSLLFSKNGGTIICQSWPLPQPNSEFFTAETGKSINGNMFGNMILALALGTALGSLVVNPVVERANRSKFLQVVSGVRMSSYWAATFVFDFCIWTAFVSIYIVILQIFKVGPFTGATAISLWIVMLISGAATLLMVYCWSFKLATPSGALGASTAGLVIFLVVLMIGWLVPTTVIISNGLPLATSDVLTIPYCIGIAFVVIFPPLSMMIGSSLLANMIKVLCSMGMKPDANATFFRIFVAINICQILAYTIILFILEASSRQSVTHSDRDIAKRAIDDEGSSAESDVDVKAEQSEIFAGHRDGDHVVARSLRQEFVSAKTGQVKVAVAGISFGVKKGEVLGILGPNGAGKTSTLSILTCDHMPSSGTYAVCGHDATDLDAVRRCIGVCPQHDALFMHMTPTENIYLFARLRGIPENKISQMCDNLLGLVKMQPHAHVLCGKLSGGNKRKISLVVSLIGAPPAIFMDEPSSGMDIIAKRFFWRVIEALRKEHAIILTTHSMEEAESVCSRVGIIVDGKLRCLGSLQRIKSVYGTGYDVQLKPSQLDQVSACKGFMRSQLPASILVEEHGTTLKYTVPREAVSSVSSIFETVGKLSRDIGMSEFGVCQTSLEQVFLHFGKQQRILSGIDELEERQVLPYKSPFDILPASSTLDILRRGFLFALLGLGIVPFSMAAVVATVLFIFVIPFPVGRMFLRLMTVQLTPLDREWSGGPLTSDKRVMHICSLLNVMFFFCGGGLLFLFHLLMAFIFFLTIFGYKIALVHVQLLKLVLAPYGRHILAADAPIVSSMSWWQIFNYGRGVYPCCCCDPKLPTAQMQEQTLERNHLAPSPSSL